MNRGGPVAAVLVGYGTAVSFLVYYKPYDFVLCFVVLDQVPDFGHVCVVNLHRLYLE